MKFLIDAQLPRRLARRLRAAGHDAIHTLDLPAGNRTTDAEICRIADSDGRAVVTKDADFVSSFMLVRILETAGAPAPFGCYAASFTTGLPCPLPGTMIRPALERYASFDASGSYQSSFDARH